MTFSEDELRRIVETCWKAASTADMAGIPDYMMSSQKDPLGNYLVNQLRVQTFYILLGCAAPKNQVNTLLNAEPKEPWEGDE